MVDFQERDTRRGLPEDEEAPEGETDPPDGGREEVVDDRREEAADERREAVTAEDRSATGRAGSDSGSRSNGPDSDDAAGRSASDGEAEIDQIRHRLEERPDDDSGEAAEQTRTDDGHRGNESEPADDPDGASADESGADRTEGDDASEPREHDSTPDRGHGSHDDHDSDEAHEHDPDDDHDHGSHDGHDHDHDHDHHRHDLETLGAAVVTVSSSRSLADDPSGDYIVQALVDAGHDVVTRELIPDDYDAIQHTVDTLVGRRDVDVVVSTGGTGVTPDDQTIEAVRPLFEKELPGFGQLFRRLSVDDIGTRAIATRATAGVADGVPVFCLPGSRAAVELGVEKLIVEEAPHLAGLASRGRETDGEPSPATSEGGRQAAGRSDGGQNSDAGPRSGDDRGR